MYTDHLEKASDLVTVNVKHIFSAEELAQQSQLLANAVNDKATEENNKKVAVSDFANKIKQLDAQIKTYSGHVATGFTYTDRSAELYRDYVRSKRVYLDKITLEVIKEEDFKESDYQKKIDFEAAEEQLTLEDMRRQTQIEENNTAGNFAEAGDALDGVISDKNPGHRLGTEGKKLSDKVKEGLNKEKPIPKNNLAENYGKDFEQQEEDDTRLPDDDDLFGTQATTEDNPPE